jgi:hypothetical protein
MLERLFFECREIQRRDGFAASKWVSQVDGVFTKQARPQSAICSKTNPIA